MALLPQHALLILGVIFDTFISTLQIFGGALLPRLRIKVDDQSGKNVIVTGGNSGIGLSIATSLAAQHANIYLACRSVDRGNDAAKQIVDSMPDRDTASKRVQVLQLDTSDLSSVRAFANSWKANGKQIDILVHNAGISGPPAGQDITSDGLGTIYVTNLLGSFLLTSLLESRLSDTARVIFTSSHAQLAGRPLELLSNPGLLPRKDKSGLKAPDSGFYGDTKSMQVIFSKLLQRRWNSNAQTTRRVTHAFTPGYTYTPIFGKMGTIEASFDPLFWFLKTATMLSTPVETGAATGLWLATTQDPTVAGPANGGRYWDRCVRRRPTADIIEAFRGTEKLQRLWNAWCKDSGAEWD